MKIWIKEIITFRSPIIKFHLMTLNRRLFLQQLGTTIGTAALGSMIFPSIASGKEFFNPSPITPPGTNSDEDFWAWVQESYTVSPNIINLNNGGVSPQPKVVQDMFEKYNRLCNEAPSYYMWNI